MCIGAEKQPKLQKVGRFGDLLKDQQLYNAFMAFLATEYAQENLAFFREVLEFESLNPSDKKELKRRAQAICERYLGIGPAGEEQKLNLPLRLISSINNNLNKKCTINLFGDARMDIEQILRTKYVSFCEL